MAPQLSDATLYYRKVWDERSPEELWTLARIKRLLEHVVGDDEFRSKIAANFDNLKVVADEYNLGIDLDQALPLFSRAHVRYRFSEEENRWPLARMWDSYISQIIHHRDMLRDLGDTSKTNPRFHAWRLRQINRAATELGGTAHSITHPIVALEIADGCSVGCWFCGISAARFKDYWPYSAENAALWRGVVGELYDLFGTGAQTGFCYWATDPSDNPDYAKFIDDYYALTGAMPQTTTAAPLKNVAWTREVLGKFKETRCVCNRFSILNRKTLRQVHKEFTPDELLGVELVLQNKEALTGKAFAGRAMERRIALRNAGKSDKVALLDIAQGTIACVSGFLINMVHREVRLISPTSASERWPLGYRIYAEGKFNTAAEFRALVDAMIDAHMREDLNGSDVLAFRPDLTYRRLAEGFELEGAGGSRYHVRGFEGAGYFGDLIHKGDKTAADVVDASIRAGLDIFEVTQNMRGLFDNGALNDDPRDGKIGGRCELHQAS
jgi:radical SAM family RiPP maturation amino acid epimerase